MGIWKQVENTINNKKILISVNMKDCLESEEDKKTWEKCGSVKQVENIWTLKLSLFIIYLPSI